MQRGLADVWKENLLEDLELGEAESELAGKFSLDTRKEFGGENKESVKVAELQRIE